MYVKVRDAVGKWGLCYTAGSASFLSYEGSVIYIAGSLWWRDWIQNTRKSRLIFRSFICILLQLISCSCVVTFTVFLTRFAHPAAGKLGHSSMQIFSRSLRFAGRGGASAPSPSKGFLLGSGLQTGSDPPCCPRDGAVVLSPLQKGPPKAWCFHPILHRWHGLLGTVLTLLLPPNMVEWKWKHNISILVSWPHDLHHDLIPCSSRCSLANFTRAWTRAAPAGFWSMFYAWQPLKLWSQLCSDHCPGAPV